MSCLLLDMYTHKKKNGKINIVKHQLKKCLKFELLQLWRPLVLILEKNTNRMYTLHVYIKKKENSVYKKKHPIMHMAK